MIAGIARAEEIYCSLEEWMNNEYLDDGKFEFRDGLLVRMPENTVRHGRIVGNFLTALHNALRKKKSKCWVTEGSQKIYFPAYNHGGYPDVAAVCGKAVLWNKNIHTIVNPLLVVEVLSKSTQDYDRGGKFAKYRSLPSFKEYVLVSQTEPKVETWFKMEENVWRISRFEGLESNIKLFSLDCEIAMADVYFLVEDFGGEPQI